MFRVVCLMIPLVLILACTPSAPTAAPAKPSPPPAAPATTAPAPAATAGPAATKPAAAAPTPTTTAKVKRGGTIKYSVTGDWPTHDPQLDQSTRGWAQINCDAAFGFELNDKTKRFEITPELVESWKLLDEKTYEWKLRKGVKFQDGSPWNAEVLKWNINRIDTHPKSTTKANVADIASVDVVDDLTAKVNLKQASAAVLVNLTAAAEGRAMILSKVAGEAKGDAFLGEHPICTGPFELTEWRKGDRTIFKRFPDHWRQGIDGQPEPYADGVEMRWIVDLAVAMVELKAGTLDMFNDVLAKDVPGLKANPDFVLVESPWMGQMRQLFFNEKAGPFAGPEKLKLRQAVAYAIDRDALVKAIGLGLGKPACYVVGEGQLGYDPSVPCYKTDPEKAKQVLVEAGYPNGIDATLTVVARQPDIPQGEVVKAALDKAGIRTTLDNIERLAWVSRTQSCLHDFSTHISAYRPDTDVIFSHRFVTGGPGNYACLSNKELDECILEGRRTTDEAKRHEVYKRCLTLQYNLAYFIPMWTPDNYSVYSNKLHGIRPFFATTNFWADLWKD
ncbi:MAG: ABC transporter substrate-binding protein [Chloroflexi bacterium]|nr:ABC transporter substrate-binding protein [Chloroflexota bacterium]